ncbi:hypothetical protein [Emticicia fluvialis]|uniref:hypothetical protein n=1 Tax=Emticicia fluvialis TaxID=2974474 RepID=UPI002165815E|nr:hypothetical protein [Emticicia fluvialis]
MALLPCKFHPKLTRIKCPDIDRRAHQPKARQGDAVAREASKPQNKKNQHQAGFQYIKCLDKGSGSHQPLIHK